MLNGIKSVFFKRILFNHINEEKCLKLINYNKQLQKVLGITIKDFIRVYNKIIIEIIPDKNSEELYSKNFINIPMEYKLFYHIYLDNNTEIKRTYLKKQDNISKIKIVIEPEVTQLVSIFEKIPIIKQIKYLKFNRKDITDMKRMFLDCKLLTDLDISKVKTDNVNNMAGMFCGCSNLKN